MTEFDFSDLVRGSNGPPVSGATTPILLLHPNLYPAYKSAAPLSNLFPCVSPHLFWPVQQPGSPLVKILFYAAMGPLQTISSPYFEDGFLPSQPAVSRLPSQWDAWEDMLSQATATLGFDLVPSPNGIPELEKWRDSVQNVRIHPHLTDWCIFQLPLRRFLVSPS